MNTSEAWDAVALAEFDKRIAYMLRRWASKKMHAYREQYSRTHSAKSATISAAKVAYYAAVEDYRAATQAYTAAAQAVEACSAVAKAKDAKARAAKLVNEFIK